MEPLIQLQKMLLKETILQYECYKTIQMANFWMNIF